MFENFVNKYQLQKTLRFELRPIGDTLKHINAKGLVEQDKERAESYKKIKKTIDAFHRDFIDLALQQVKLTQLDKYLLLYNESTETKKEDKFKKKFSELQKNLRKEIVRGFTSDATKETFSKIDKKELITELLENWIRSKKESDLYFDEKFKTFTTYFEGFHKNRRNMYTDEEQSTAIAYRLIHENLPKFVDNLKIYQEIKDKLGDSKIREIELELKDLVQEKKLADIFTLNFFNETLTQKKIDFYNTVIGGYFIDEKNKIKGINEHVNLYNQKQDKKSDRIPKLKILYKQILSNTENLSFLRESFEQDQEVLDAIEKYYKTHLVNYKDTEKDQEESILEKIKELLVSLKSYDLSKVYIKNDTSLTNISSQLFGSYSIFSESLAYYYENIINPNFKIEYIKDKKREKLDKEKDKYIKQPHFSIKQLQEALDAYIGSLDKEHDLHRHYTNTCVVDYFTVFFKAKKKSPDEKEYDLISNIKTKYSCIQGLLNTDYPKHKKLHQEKKAVGDIKEFLDSLMEFFHFIKPFALSKESLLEKDENFYSHFEVYFKQLDLLIPLYNKVRNYVTRKAYSVKKVKLNFENAELLSGWPRDREIATSSIIFRENNNYFLGILDKNSKRFFKNLPKPTSEKDAFSKMVYLQAADPSKDVQNLMVIDGKTVKKNGRKSVIKNDNYGEFVELDGVGYRGQRFEDFFILELESGEAKLKIENNKVNLVLEKLKNTYLPCRINKIRNFKSYSKQNENFSSKDLIDFIDYYKLRAKEYFSDYTFTFKSSEEYKDFSEFTDHINEQAYQINFIDVSKCFIYELVDQGKLYLFQIYNKDFSSYSKGIPNIHTLYWRALFDEKNLENVIYKLNGQAELFYREKSIEDENKIVHLANKPIENKNPNNKKEVSTFNYDLIKDKRYCFDKFQFHVPITLNFKSSGNDYLNHEARSSLKNHSNIKIIGLDRGERHLIYLTMIDQNGKIIKQKSLNIISNNKYKIETSYHSLLDKKEKDRAEARVSWGTIESIKELKEGYLSQVVHEITTMMVENNAIVVMEDLNFGFKRGRFKVEKQIYQKLETMLINKLNYLVFKNKEPHELGGLYKALQLTNKSKSFKELGKQSGFLFYVPAWNTSKIDPATGFVNLFDTKYENIEKTRAFFNTFDVIRYNASKGYFEFHFDYKNYPTRVEVPNSKWVVCSTNHKRYVWERKLNAGKGAQKLIDVNQEMKDLFSKENINFLSGEDLKQAILDQNNTAFYQKLLFLFSSLLLLRYNNGKKDEDERDYILSPVYPFFNSLDADDSRPKDADANGAYHIALKGLLLLDRIRKTDQSELSKLELNIENKEWLNFVKEISSRTN